MRRALTRFSFAAIVVVAAVFALFAYVGAPSGQKLISSIVSIVSGGKLSVSGLTVRLPGELNIRELTVRDGNGAWLIVENGRIDGSFLALARGDIEVHRLSASRVRLIRLPVSDNSALSLPHIDVAVADVSDVETGPELTGSAMRFSGAGSLHMQSETDVAADVRLTRRDGEGSYSVNGRFRNGAFDGVVTIDEPAKGLVTGMLGLNAIGPIRVDLRAAASPAANRFSFIAHAGLLKITGNGVAQIPARTVDVDFSATAPAMNLRPDLSWQSLSSEGHAHGPIDALVLKGDFQSAGLHAGPISAAMITGAVNGSSGSVDLTASAFGLVLPGVNAGLLSGAPIELRAHAKLDAPHRPIDFQIAHPLLAATGNAQLDGTGTISVSVTLPKLQPIAALAGVKLEGRASFSTQLTLAHGISVTMLGRLAATGGDPTVAHAIGANAAFSAAADLNGNAVSNLKLNIKGDRTEANIRGGLRNGVLDVAASGTVKDVSRLVADLNGDASLNATAVGPLDAVRLKGTLSGTLGAKAIEPQRISLNFDGAGSTKNASGAFRGDASFKGRPVTAEGTFGWSAATLHIAVAKGAWESVSLSGDADISQAGSIQGAGSVHADRLEDLEPWLGFPATGTVDARFDLQQPSGDTELGIRATAHDVAFQGARFATLTTEGHVVNLLTTPRLAMKAAASGISAQGISGTLTTELNGTLDNLTVALTGDLRDTDERPLSVHATAVLRQKAREARLTAFSVDYQHLRADMAEPAMIAFADGIAVDRLNLRSGGSQLIIRGRITPVLLADVTLDGVSAAMLRPVMPSLSEASLSAMAHLVGTLSAPRGSISITGRGLRLQGVPADVPPGTLTGHADLDNGAMRIDASLNLSNSKLTVSGDVPLAPNGKFDLKTTGTADLSLFNGDLTAAGRRMLGQATIDGVVRGTLATPDITGSAKLTNAELQDSANGLRVTAISGDAMFKGSSLEILNLSGRAGAGTVKLNGSIDLAGSGIPVHLVLTARNAEPVSNDILHANVDADLTVTGNVTDRLKVAGKILVRRAESVLPNSLPPEVANLDVKRSGKEVSEATPVAGPSAIALDLDISSPGQFFLRGHGLDSELEGNVHAGGTLSAPVVTGAFTMRRGTLDLGGSTLNFNSGKVTFENASLRNRLDPALDFVAQSVSGVYTAKLEITGTVSKPKVQLTSTPTLPQDEILSQLLFQQDVKQLTALQLAQMAQAAASLGGFGGGFDPLGSARRLLGLDRLSVSNGPNNQAQLEAGKYVTRNVFVGAKQGLSNAPQAEVQIDLTKHLKATATIATGSTAAVTQGAQQQDPGTSAGLSWQFEY